MANLQYVGPRVVPKPYRNPDTGDASWKSGVAYEALMMVTYNGNGYVSALPVPPSVGNPADNPDYWVESADFDAALSDLQNRVSDLENVVGTGTLPHSESDIIDTLNYLDKPYDYVVWIGDSYTGAASLGADIHHRYSTRVSKMLRLTEKNYAQGGSSFLGGNRDYLLQTQDAIDDFTNNSLDPTKVKYFIIGGTRNDQIIAEADEDDYIARVRAVITAALGYFTKAEVIIIPLLWDYHPVPIGNFRTLSLLKYACGTWQDRVTIIDKAWTWFYSRITDVLYQDGANVHWTKAGHLHAARHVYSSIMGNNYDNSSCRDLPLTSWYSGIESAGREASIMRYNGKTKFEIAFTVGGSNINPRTLANASYNDIYHGLNDCYIGGNPIIFTVWNSDHTKSAQVTLTINVTRTGDTTGSWNIDVSNMTTVEAGVRYIGGFDVPVGILERSYDYT